MLFWRVTIVGRPNVGKSSLFNILTGHKIAIVSDVENTTRDVIEYHLKDHERAIEYVLADSGGLTSSKDDLILRDVRKRVEDSIVHSDIILFVVEYDKITTVDETIARMLRKSGKPVIILANKADNQDRIQEAYGIVRLGFKDFIITSSAHSLGKEAILVKIHETYQSLGYSSPIIEDDPNMLKVAIIGRPNVGKSSLLNALVWESRAVVADLAGTTRDSTDTLMQWKEKQLTLIDTAGIRRAGKVWSQNIEAWSVLRSERAVTRADIVVIVVDAYEGITAQDKHVVSLALEEKKGVILVFNKWDKVLSKPGIDLATIQEKYLTYIRTQFNFLSYVTPLFVSAIEGKRIDIILDSVLCIDGERKKRVRTSVFNDFLAQITLEHTPSGSRKSHKPKIYYGSQVDVNPPKFVISVNNPNHFHFSYLRYVENKIREFFGFEGTPIHVELHGKEREDHDGE